VTPSFNIEHSTFNIQHSSSPKIAILAGGFGTRLGALTQGLPKPMIPINGRPYLERVIDSFARRGLRDFVLLTGYRAEIIEEHFGDGGKFGVHITYSRETEPLGTGGAIREARALLGETFVMTYGDVLRYYDYDRFVAAHGEPCVAVYPRRTVGNADVDGDRIIRFDKRAPELPYIDAGFSLMPSSVIDLLPPTGPCSFEESIFPRLAAERRLACEVVDLNFFDIGTPEELARTTSGLVD
jgi:D-glycero-alpha-D-manno-heptose 1-phosphate guanylyltransferase